MSCGQGQGRRTVKADGRREPACQLQRQQHPLQRLTALVKLFCTPSARARIRSPLLLSLCPPAFPGGRWGAQRGWGAPGSWAGLSRAPLPRHCGGSSNQSAPGGSSRAGTTRLGGGGWAASPARPHPRPPRVRGGGSVCSLTNGPSRPARPLAQARRGPARARSSSSSTSASCSSSRRSGARPRAGQPRSPPPLKPLRAARVEAPGPGGGARLERGRAPARR